MRGGFICSAVLVLLIVPALIPFALAESKHPFTFEDMMSLKRDGGAHRFS